MWSYDELLSEARAGGVASVQIAVQHDCVVAKDQKGHRYACLMPDEHLPQLILDAMKSDGSVPFDIIPLDQVRATVRDVAWASLNFLGVLWVADLAGLLPWDTTPYNSLKEREEAAQNEEQQGSRYLFHQLGQKLRRITPAKRHRRKKLGADEEALQRVLGLTKWDAAAELKDALRDSKQQFGRELGKARPRQLEQQIIDVAGKLQASAEELETRLREAAWVTPSTLESTASLPTLNQLLTRSWPVSTDGLVTQYIRAHPATLEEKRSAFPKAELMGGPWPTTEHKSEGCGAEVSHTHCRLCPDFSAFYNHDVYICKQLVTV